MDLFSVSELGQAVHPKLLGNKIHPTVHSLCNKEDRIRVYEVFGEVIPNQGFFVTKNHIYIPYGLPKVAHDISHLLELRNSNRWAMTDWGMPRFEEDLVKPKQFFAAFAREIRTRAIQLHLSSFDSERDMHYSTTYSQLNNVYWAEMTKKLLPFGRFKTYQDVEIWNADLREKTSKCWSLDRIHHEWDIRLDYLRNWMESI